MLSVILVRTVERAPTNLEATNARAVRDTPEGTVRQVKALTNASFLWLLANSLNCVSNSATEEIVRSS